MTCTKRVWHARGGHIGGHFETPNSKVLDGTDEEKAARKGKGKEKEGRRKKEGYGGELGL